MNLKILKWKLLLYKVKIYGYTLNLIKRILDKHDIKAIRLLYSVICKGLVDLYMEILEKDESCSLY